MTKSKSLTVAQGQKTKEDLAALMKPVSARCDQQKELENAALVAFELDQLSVKLGRWGWVSKPGTPEREKIITERMKQRFSDDWTEALREYPVFEVRRAIGDYLEWRANKLRRGEKLKNDFPTEQDIKSFLLKRRFDAMNTAPKAAVPLSKPKLTEAEIEARQEAARRIMKEIAEGKSGKDE